MNSTSTDQVFLYITFLFWIAFIVYWIVDIYRVNKKTIAQELQGLISLTGTALVVYLPIHWGFLGNHVLPNNTATRVAGVVVCAAGLLFAAWGRETLGKSWSAAVALQKDHKLIQGGPYGFVRHPMYTGLLLGLLGSSVVIGIFWGFFLTIILTLGIIGKLTKEEALLTKHFPREYPAYKQRVKALLPFIY
jgi:protein-S-isoprenylcysteine O-methyltransferase Ste14